MLGDEHGMAAHRSLPAVIGRLGRRQATRDEIPGMGENGWKALPGKVGGVRRVQPEAGPERRAGKGFEQVVKCTQGPTPGPPAT